MANIIVEEVGDINFEYPYLEVFIEGASAPFLEVGISASRKLSFKFHSSKVAISLTRENLEFITAKADAFLPAALKSQDDLLTGLKESW